MKKKAIAWTAAILIVTLISAVFLRPAPGEFGYADEVICLSREVELRLIGRDAELFRAYDCGDTVSRSAYGKSVRIECIDAARTFTIGSISEQGNGIEYVPYGVLQKKTDGEWVTLRDIRSTSNAMTGIEHFYFASQPKTPLTIDLSVCDAGEYRAMLTLREHIDGVGSVGEYEIGFEFDVPSATDKPFDIICTELRLSPRDESIAGLGFIARSNDGTQIYPITESVAVSGGATVEWDGGENMWQYDSFAERFGGASVCGVSALVFRNVDHEQTYELTMDFAENPDGSGERYTLQFCINFNEEE